MGNSDSIKNLLSTNIFSMLHPNFGELSNNEKYNLMAEKFYIEEHASDILFAYNQYERTMSGSGKHYTREQILRLAVNHLRGKELFDKLHPDYKVLNPQQQLRLQSEKIFIEDNLPIIDTVFQDYLTSNDVKNIGLSEYTILRTAVNYVWADKIFYAIYPNFNSYTKDEKLKVINDLNLIRDHTEEFIFIYQDIGHSSSHVKKAKGDKRNLLKETLEELRKRKS